MRIHALEIFLLAVMLSGVTPALEAQPAAQDPAAGVPVVLVHGYKDTSEKLEKMAQFLRLTGRAAYPVTVSPSYGQVGIEELAGQLGTYIAAHFAPEQRIDLVGFSMGGLVCRYYVQRLGGLERVDHLVTLSTPHNGTETARLLGNTGGLEMRPDSGFLRDLNRDKTVLNRIKFTSIWTPLDLMILPPESSRTGVGREIKLWIIMHSFMVCDGRVMRAVAEELRR